MSSMAWVGRLAASAALAVLVGCGSEESTAPEKPLSADASRSEVHALAARFGCSPQDEVSRR